MTRGSPAVMAACMESLPPHTACLLHSFSSSVQRTLSVSLHSLAPALPAAGPLTIHGLTTFAITYAC